MYVTICGYSTEEISAASIPLNSLGEYHYAHLLDAVGVEVVLPKSVNNRNRVTIYGMFIPSPPVFQGLDFALCYALRPRADR
jgi:hypothetical protein